MITFFRSILSFFKSYYRFYYRPMFDPDATQPIIRPRIDLDDTQPGTPVQSAQKVINVRRPVILSGDRWTFHRVEETLRALREEIALTELPIIVHTIYINRKVAETLNVFDSHALMSLAKAEPNAQSMAFKILIDGRFMNVVIANTTQFGEVEFGVTGLEDTDRLRDADDYAAALFAMSALT